MYRYCVGRLRMSEDMAYKRIRASRAARKFPAILALLADGRLHLSGVLLLAPYLTTSNAAELLAAAALRTRAALEQLLAARFPRPDLAARVQPFPPAASPGQQAPGPVEGTPPEAFSRALLAMDPGAIAGVSLAVESPAGSSRVGSEAPVDITDMSCQLAPGPVAPPAPVAPPELPARITPLAPGRFGIQLTIGSAAHEKLRDEGRCTFVSEQGQRCESREFLELDHLAPVAKGGESTVANVRLRCHTHNQYEAERAFGAGFMERKREVSRRRAEAQRAAARAKEAERARREAYACELEANAEAKARALEVMPWLRALGVRADDARRAAARSEELPDAPLEERIPHALRGLAPARARRIVPVPSPPA